MRSVRTFVSDLSGLLAVGALLTIGLGGCAFNKADEATINGGVGSGGADGGTAIDLVARNDGTVFMSDVNTDVYCDAITATPTPLPPDILILLDRSGSMANDINDKGCGTSGTLDCGAASKWTQMTAAINQAVTSSESNVRWGLRFFGNGSDNTCGVTAGAAGTAVAPGLSTSAAIAAAIAGTRPATGTPTANAETTAAAYLQTLTDPNPKFILLATDGKPTCAGGSNVADDSPAAIAAVGAVASAGLKTFVVGIATTGMGTADTTLNTMADMGGEPQSGTTHYYPVMSTADLVATIQKIQGIAALTCTYDLGGQPTDTNGVKVLVDGTQLDPGPDTWKFSTDDKTIELTGTTCASVMNSTIQKVQIFLPCGIVIM
ncbi:MAG TPA: VWA domain-containing protein [Polyangia bacterium]|jgi:hypothetical protein